MPFVKAERSKCKSRIGICSPAGGGKTHTSLLLAGGLGGRIALIDTENASASKEVGKKNIPEFDTLTLFAPFTAEKYIEAIKEAEKAGYDVIIIDSLSHAWAGSGGLLERADQITEASKSKNSYMSWRAITPVHNKLIDAILQSKCHVIATMRSKTDYVLEENESGKKVPKKIGLAPVQREGMDYEFDIVLDIDQSTHKATATKDRTSLFGNEPFLGTVEIGKDIMRWLDEGVNPIIRCHQCKESEATTKATSPAGNEYDFCEPCAVKVKAAWEAKSAPTAPTSLTEPFDTTNPNRSTEQA